MKILFMLLIALCGWMPIHAQKTCVVANAEDHVPIREALIHTNNNHWARTDYRGYWTMKYQFDSAVVSKSGFLKTTVYLKSLPDTLFLLPESRQLGTVEVWGKNQQHVKDMEQQVENAAKNAPRPTTGASFDLANMLDKRGRRDHKHLKDAKSLLKQYDYKDPIVSAYEQATGKKYQLRRPDSKVLGKAEEDETDAIKSDSQEETEEQKKSSKTKTQISVESTVSVTK